ncbi:VirB3 family type IV secretion system protein [Yoonia sp. MH D7]
MLQAVRPPVWLCVTLYGGTVIPLIWSVSVFTVVWCALVYGLCRWAAEKDEKIVEVLLTGARVVPGTRTRKMFGGDSYGA